MRFVTLVLAVLVLAAVAGTFFIAPMGPILIRAEAISASAQIVPPGSGSSEADAAGEGEGIADLEPVGYIGAGAGEEAGEQAIVSDGPWPGGPIAAKRVGIQAGHWQTAEMPDELRRLRTATGSSGGGVAEWELNLDIATRAAALLQEEGIDVDVLPATIPAGYEADAFIALHADGDVTGRLSGFKIAAPRVSAVAEADEALRMDIQEEYQAATGLLLDTNITRSMTGYYAFSFRRFQHAIAPTTPAAIIEMGFLTNASDRLTLLGNEDAVAAGITKGILRFLAVNNDPASESF